MVFVLNNYRALWIIETHYPHHYSGCWLIISRMLMLTHAAVFRGRVGGEGGGGTDRFSLGGMEKKRAHTHTHTRPGFNVRLWRRPASPGWPNPCKTPDWKKGLLTRVRRVPLALSWLLRLVMNETYASSNWVHCLGEAAFGTSHIRSVLTQTHNRWVCAKNARRFCIVRAWMRWLNGGKLTCGTLYIPNRPTEKKNNSHIYYN